MINKYILRLLLIVLCVSLFFNCFFIGSYVPSPATSEKIVYETVYQDSFSSTYNYSTHADPYTSCNVSYNNETLYTYVGVLEGFDIYFGSVDFAYVYVFYFNDPNYNGTYFSMTNRFYLPTYVYTFDGTLLDYDDFVHRNVSLRFFVHNTSLVLYSLDIVKEGQMNMANCYRCGKKPANPLYCDDCVEELSETWASWAVGEITEEERKKITGQG